MASAAYSILVNVEAQTQEAIKQVQSAFNKQSIKIGVDVGGVEEATKAAENLGLTFQEANLIMSRSLDIITSMVDEVYALDSSLTEFKKVSDLSGASLENYTNKLSAIGKTVARTGKPKSQARSDGMVNQH